MAWTQTTITTKDASGNTKTTYVYTDGTAYVFPANLLDANGNLITPAQDGTDGSGISQPSGGAGIRGWLSGIYNRLAGVVLAAGSAIIGQVGIDQTTPGESNAVSIDQSSYGSTNLVTAAITNVGATSVTSALPASNVSTLPVSSHPNAIYLTASQAANTSGTGTTVTFSNLNEAGNTIFDADVVQIVILNPTASLQAITAATLTFSDTLSSSTITNTYTLPLSGNIAAGSSQQITLALVSGVLKTPKVNVTFAANPSASTVYVLGIFRKGGIMTGPAPSGQPVSSNPVLIGGSDGTDARTIATDAGGKIILSVPGQTTKSASTPVVLPSDAKVKNYIQGSPITLIAGSALNAMANNTVVVGSAVNSQQGQTADGCVYGRVQLTFKFQSAPTANTGFSLYFAKSADGGTTYEDTTNPTGTVVAVFGVTMADGTTDTNAHIESFDIQIPPGYWKPVLKNNGTGQTTTANNTDNVLTFTPWTQQGNV